jgi:hypothetical protein
MIILLIAVLLLLAALGAPLFALIAASRCSVSVLPDNRARRSPSSSIASPTCPR